MNSIIHRKDEKNKQNDEGMPYKNTGRFLHNFFSFWASTHGFFILVLVFTSSLSFFLGKMSVVYSNQVVDNRPHRIVHAETAEVTTQVVVSKKGSVYHLPWCSGAVRMKEENKVYFDTVSAAKDAGYVAAKNCEGL